MGKPPVLCMSYEFKLIQYSDCIGSEETKGSVA